MHPSSISLFLRNFPTASTSKYFSLTFVHVMEMHIFFVSQPNFLGLVNHISVILVSYNHLDFFLAFLVSFLSTWLLIFYLGHFVSHLGLLCSFSDDFIYCLSLLDQGHSFDVIMYLIITLYPSTTCNLWWCIILFHYLSFTTICHLQQCLISYLFSTCHLLYVVTYIISSD
jgi:hypothetical protein